MEHTQTTESPIEERIRIIESFMPKIKNIDRAIKHQRLKSYLYILIVAIATGIVSYSAIAELLGFELSKFEWDGVNSSFKPFIFFTITWLFLCEKIIEPSEKPKK